MHRLSRLVLLSTLLIGPAWTAEPPAPRETLNLKPGWRLHVGDPAEKPLPDPIHLKI